MHGTVISRLQVARKEGEWWGTEYYFCQQIRLENWVIIRDSLRCGYLWSQSGVGVGEVSRIMRDIGKLMGTTRGKVLARLWYEIIGRSLGALLLHLQLRFLESLITIFKDICIKCIYFKFRGICLDCHKNIYINRF